MIEHYHLFIQSKKGPREGEIFCHLCGFSKQECFEIEKATHCNTPLRDQFAMAALTRLHGVRIDADVNILANHMYKIADAMLEARKVEK